MKIKALKEARYAQNYYVDWIADYINRNDGINWIEVPADKVQETIKAITKALGEPYSTTRIAGSTVILWTTSYGRTFYIELLIQHEGASLNIRSRKQPNIRDRNRLNEAKYDAQNRFSFTGTFKLADFGLNHDDPKYDDPEYIEQNVTMSIKRGKSHTSLAGNTKYISVVEDVNGSTIVKDVVKPNYTAELILYQSQHWNISGYVPSRLRTKYGDRWVLYP